MTTTIFINNPKQHIAEGGDGGDGNDGQMSVATFVNEVFYKCCSDNKLITLTISFILTLTISLYLPPLLYTLLLFTNVC